jgi:fluoride exporter
MNSLYMQFLLIAAGGAAGGIGRFWISGLIAKRYGEDFPWGTLVVNVTGATAIGVLAAFLLLPEMHEPRFASAWALFAAGILGSYTTVSTFSLQTLALLHSGEVAHALGNVIASTGLCVSGAAIGFFAGRAMMGL